MHCANDNNGPWDIFISYKMDNIGNNFVRRLTDDLQAMNYSVFFNKDAIRTGSFPEQQKEAVIGCKDFLLILSETCLAQLCANEKVDWVREELLIAHEYKKNIIPVLMPGVILPKDRSDMPEIITFLPDQNAFLLPDEYLQPPLQKLMKSLHSRPERGDVYRAVFNGNPDFKVEDYRRTLEKKAAQGDPEAKYALALVYYYGMIDADGKSGRAYSKAFELLSELQDLPGEIGAHANALIGEMYFNGTVPQEGQSFITAREHHKKAAEYSAFSAREYAYICSRGCGDSMDTDEITQYYEKVIEVGDKIAVLGLAQYYKEHGRFREAAALYEKSKEQIPEAEMELGVIYAKGLHKDPPEPDYFRAASLLHHAIGRENCDPRAYYELGVLYLMPYGGFIKDEKKAQELFAEAAARGVANAAFKLGCMFEYGTVEKNTETAIEYFTMASEAGRPLAAYHLALLYQQPEVCNYHKAFRYAKIAAERGVPEGEYVYGSMLLFGRGCKADRDAAMRHLRSAYKHGVFQAKMLIDAQKNAPAALPSSERD